jgi:hypothetical protein
MKMKCCENDPRYLKRRLDFKELEGNAILALKVHPGGRRLLIQCRSLSHPVAMLDLVSVQLNLIFRHS